MEGRPAEQTVATVNERPLAFHHRDGLLDVAGRNYSEQRIRRRGTGDPAGCLPPALLGRFDDGNEFVIPALRRQGERTGRIAVGIDAFTRIRTELDESTHQLGRVRCRIAW